MDLPAYLASLPTSVPIAGAERQELIDHAGRINKKTYQVVAGVFFGVAMIFAVLRTILRLKLRHRLFLDDYLVFFAAVCLVIATAIYYHMCHWLYMIEAVNLDARVVFTLVELIPLSNALMWIDIWLAFIWTATYAIKMSFLVFFRPLTRAVSRKLNIYYWFTVGFTIAAWMFTAPEGIILCPHFGKNALRCYPNSPYKLNVGLTGLVTFLDIATDAMVVSIPLIILNLSQLKRSQKAGIAVFLCLSTAMIIVALTRIIGAIRPTLRAKADADTLWEIFWQQFEGSIAVTMGSITAFRGIFAGQTLQSLDPEQQDSTPFKRFLNRLGLSRKTTGSSVPEDHREAEVAHLPEHSISHATLKGLRTFIRRYGRGVGHTTVGLESDTDPFAEYHDFQRAHNKPQKAHIVAMHDWSPLSTKSPVSASTHTELCTWPENSQDESRI